MAACTGFGAIVVDGGPAPAPLPWLDCMGHQLHIGALVMTNDFEVGLLQRFEADGWHRVLRADGRTVMIYNESRLRNYDAACRREWRTLRVSDAIRAQLPPAAAVELARAEASR
jgi:hypothetical protein